MLTEVRSSMGDTWDTFPHSAQLPRLDFSLFLLGPSLWVTIQRKKCHLWEVTKAFSGTDGKALLKKRTRRRRPRLECASAMWMHASKTCRSSSCSCMHLKAGLSNIVSFRSLLLYFPVAGGRLTHLELFLAEAGRLLSGGQQRRHLLGELCQVEIFLLSDVETKRVFPPNRKDHFKPNSVFVTKMIRALWTGGSHGKQLAGLHP